MSEVVQLLSCPKTIQYHSFPGSEHISLNTVYWGFFAIDNSWFKQLLRSYISHFQKHPKICKCWSNVNQNLVFCFQIYFLSENAKIRHQDFWLRRGRLNFCNWSFCPHTGFHVHVWHIMNQVPARFKKYWKFYHSLNYRGRCNFLVFQHMF